MRRVRTSSSFSSSPSASASRYSTSSRTVGSTSASSSSGVGSRPCSTAAAARACATCSAVTTIASRPAETDSPRQADTANSAAPISQEMHERIFDEPRHAIAREEKRPRIMAARAAGSQGGTGEKKGPGQRGEGDWPGPYSNRKKPIVTRSSKPRTVARRRGARAAAPFRRGRAPRSAPPRPRQRSPTACWLTRVMTSPGRKPFSAAALSGWTAATTAPLTSLGMPSVARSPSVSGRSERPSAALPCAAPPPRGQRRDGVVLRLAELDRELAAAAIAPYRDLRRLASASPPPPRGSACGPNRSRAR